MWCNPMRIMSSLLVLLLVGLALSEAAPGSVEFQKKGKGSISKEIINGQWARIGKRFMSPSSSSSSSSSSSLLSDASDGAPSALANPCSDATNVLQYLRCTKHFRQRHERAMAESALFADLLDEYNDETNMSASVQ